jgi:uncharacterized membrane protein
MRSGGREVHAVPDQAPRGPTARRTNGQSGPDRAEVTGPPEKASGLGSRSVIQLREGRIRPRCSGPAGPVTRGHVDRCSGMSRTGRPGPTSGPDRESGADRESRPDSALGVERDPGRIVAFSDGVFAISVTLLVLEIRPPQDTRRLLHGLIALWPSYLGYVITFLLIGQIWANHHVMFDHIHSVDRVVLFLNTLLLMDIAFLPFAASILAKAFRDGHDQRTAVVFYGVAFNVAAILFNVIWQYARRGRRLLGPTISSAGATAIGRRFLLAPAWIGAGTVLGTLFAIPGVAVIAAFIPFYWLPIRGETGEPPGRGRDGGA